MLHRNSVVSLYKQCMILYLRGTCSVVLIKCWLNLQLNSQELSYYITCEYCIRFVLTKPDGVVSTN